jgi:ubiquinone/menaquinone biosynthesis C-methylase UbiE
MNPSDRAPLFDNWARTYDASIASSSGSFPFDGYEQILDEVVRLAEVESRMQILDLGIGTGNLAARFVRQGCAVWGVDFSAGMLAEARARLPEVRLVQADLLGEWPPELHQPFDRVVCAYVFPEFTGKG